MTCDCPDDCVDASLRRCGCDHEEEPMSETLEELKRRYKVTRVDPVDPDEVRNDPDLGAGIDGLYYPDGRRIGDPANNETRAPNAIGGQRKASERPRD